MHDRADRGFNENSLHVVGHVRHDPRSLTRSGVLLTTFSVSANRGNAVEWFQVSTRGPLASYCQGEVRKGQMVYVRGALRRRTYEDRDGNVQAIMEIVASQVEISCGPRRQPELLDRCRTLRGAPDAVVHAAGDTVHAATAGD